MHALDQKPVTRNPGAAYKALYLHYTVMSLPLALEML